jgi:hypothetical protein
MKDIFNKAKNFLLETTPVSYWVIGIVGAILVLAIIT